MAGRGGSGSMNNGIQPAWINAVAEATESPLDERFEGFLRDEREALLKFLRTRLPTEEDAQDAVQESLIRMIRYRDSEPLEAWKRLLYRIGVNRSEEHTSELQSLMRISYAVFCLNHITIPSNRL